MHPLHLSKVAVGCASLDILAERIAARTERGEASITTRYRPKRHAELVGGSLYWILPHRFIARQTILGFEELSEERRTLIRLDARLVPVRARPKRVHQGWRYLAAEAAPADVGGGEADLSSLPSRLLDELSLLALV